MNNLNDLCKVKTLKMKNLNYNKKTSRELLLTGKNLLTYERFCGKISYTVEKEWFYG